MCVLTLNTPYGSFFKVYPLITVPMFVTHMAGIFLDEPIPYKDYPTRQKYPFCLLCFPCLWDKYWVTLIDIHTCHLIQTTLIVVHYNIVVFHFRTLNSELP